MMYEKEILMYDPRHYNVLALTLVMCKLIH